MRDGRAMPPDSRVLPNVSIYRLSVSKTDTEGLKQESKKESCSSNLMKNASYRDIIFYDMTRHCCFELEQPRSGLNFYLNASSPVTQKASTRSRRSLCFVLLAPRSPIQYQHSWTHPVSCSWSPHFLPSFDQWLQGKVHFNLNHRINVP